MTNPNDSLTSLKDILASLLESAKLPFNPNDALIWNTWEEIVGSTIAKHARPSWIKDGRLWVKVSDPIWLQELRFIGDRIKEKINVRLGREAVKQIEFRIESR